MSAHPCRHVPINNPASKLVLLTMALSHSTSAPWGLRGHLSGWGWGWGQETRNKVPGTVAANSLPLSPAVSCKWAQQLCFRMDVEVKFMLKTDFLMTLF